VRLVRALIVFYLFGGLITSIAVLQAYFHARAEGMPSEKGLTFKELAYVIFLWPVLLVRYLIN
jgi:hypothetical protein